MRELSHEQFQSLSRCEAIQMAKAIEERFDSLANRSNLLGFESGLEAAYQRINSSLKRDGINREFSYTIGEEPK